MEIFDIINIRPNESIKIICDNSQKRASLIRNMTHALHTRYNMEIIVVSRSYIKTKNMEHETIFRKPKLFFELINRNKIKIDRNTVLVLDDCCDQIKCYDILTQVFKDNKFYNIIFAETKNALTFWHINVIFCACDAALNSIYNSHIGKKNMPKNIFSDIFNECMRDNNALMLNEKHDSIVIKKCIFEQPDTYIDYYNDNFSYKKNVFALHRIYNNLSIYHNINSELFLGLWDNLNFIYKCSYVLFIFNILKNDLYDSLYLPTELYTIILCHMMELYRKNDIKDFNVKYYFEEYADKLKYTPSGRTD